MKKSEFVKLVNSLEADLLENERIASVLSGIGLEFSEYPESQSFKALKEFLEKDMPVMEHIGTDLDYYFYETDCGRSPREVKQGNKTYLLRNASDLYDIIHSL